MQCPCGGETKSVTLVRTRPLRKLEFDECKTFGRQGNYLLLWVAARSRHANKKTDSVSVESKNDLR